MSKYTEPVAVLSIFNPKDFDTILTTPSTNVEVDWETELEKEQKGVSTLTLQIGNLYNATYNTTNGFVKSTNIYFSTNTQYNIPIQKPTGGAFSVPAGTYLVTCNFGISFAGQYPSGQQPGYTYATELSWFGMVVGVANPQYNYCMYNDITSWGMYCAGTFIVQTTATGGLVISVGWNTKNAVPSPNIQMGIQGNGNDGQFTIVKLK